MPSRYRSDVGHGKIGVIVHLQKVKVQIALMLAMKNCYDGAPIESLFST